MEGQHVPSHGSLPGTSRVDPGQGAFVGERAWRGRVDAEHSRSFLLGETSGFWAGGRDAYATVE